MGDADNLAALMAMPGQWLDRIRQRRPMKKLILDMDSSVSETYGQRKADFLPGGSRTGEILEPVLETDRIGLRYGPGATR